jgi:hypothetical protein
MAGPSIAVQGVNVARTRAKAGSQAQPSPNTSKKWKKKIHRVEPGDIVRFHTPNVHQFGSVATVVGYVSAHEVIVKTFGGNDRDYPAQYISVYDREPNRHYTDPANQQHGPQVVKKRKKTPVRFLRVHPESLPDVLSGEVPVERGVHVVLDENAPTVPEQIVAQP